MENENAKLLVNEAIDSSEEQPDSAKAKRKSVLIDPHTGLEISLSGNITTFVNISKSYIGAGILGLPYGIKNAGLYAGMITMVFLAFVSTYSIHILVRCKRKAREIDKNAVSYADIGRIAFGKVGQIIAELIIFTCQLGFVCAYLLIIGENLHSISQKLSVTEYVLIIALPEIFFTWLPSLKYFGPLSAIVLIVWAFGATVVIIYGFQVLEIHSYDFIHLSTFPLFFGSVVYAFEGITLIIPMEASMKHPEKFTTILNLSVVLVTILFAGFSSLGYMFFFDQTQDVITLNLPDTVLSVLVKIAFCIVLFLTYPLGMVPLVQIAESRILPKITFIKTTIASKLLRTLLVFFTVVLTLGIPDFGVMMGFFGSFSNAFVTFILPSSFYLKLFGRSLSRLSIVVNFLIAVLGFIAMGISTYYSFLKILDLWGLHV